MIVEGHHASIDASVGTIFFRFNLAFLVHSRHSCEALKVDFMDGLDAADLDEPFTLLQWFRVELLNLALLGHGPLLLLLDGLVPAHIPICVSDRSG